MTIFLIMIAVPFLYLGVGIYRLNMIRDFVNARIEELYQRGDFAGLKSLAIKQIYDDSTWDLRKWKYHHFFPESVK